ncbi:hypothetical protein [uncultured Methanospirillum sp.]|uniref:hypothetical protein n=1 Tax=uncultured Methanospirillum sp. TaxID=262503 RepID=UPI0029C8EEE3|nr:hypothetical protein [uncultured Methanospirillum sp.]
MLRSGILAVLLITVILFSGCTGKNQDDDFKTLVQKVADDFKDQKELIVKPNQGLTVEKLNQYKSAAASAKASAEAMTLSDKSGKARGIFVMGMNATVTAVDTLQAAGKLTSPTDIVTTESVNGFFITTQTKIDDACDMVGIDKEKTF